MMELIWKSVRYNNIVQQIYIVTNKKKTKNSCLNKCLFLQEGSVPLAKVEITLADCLACSGCITSAESILITQQSQEEILRIFEENKTLKLVCNFVIIHKK